MGVRDFLEVAEGCLEDQADQKGKGVGEVGAEMVVGAFEHSVLAVIDFGC